MKHFIKIKTLPFNVYDAETETFDSSKDLPFLTQFPNPVALNILQYEYLRDFLTKWTGHKKSRGFRIDSFLCFAKFHQHWFLIFFAKVFIERGRYEFRNILVGVSSFLFEKNTQIKFTLLMRDKKAEENTSSDMESKLRMSVC